MSPHPTTASPRRAPATGGYARGEETRRRLVEAAFTLFGEDGYEQASTRRLAAMAGVNPPALQYYFDGKAGLHRACGQAIVDAALERLGEPLIAAEAAATASDRAAATEALCSLMEGLLDLLLSSKESPGRRSYLARALIDAEAPGYGVVRDALNAPIARASARLLAVASGKVEVDDAVRLKVALLLSQMTAFGLHRGATLQGLGWDGFSEDRMVLVRQVLKESVAALAASGPG